MPAAYRASRDPADAAETAHHVAAGVYIGGYRAAADPALVRMLGVARIVKMFADDPAYPGGFHRHPGVQYLVVAASDVPDYDIRPGAVAAVRFIREGVAAGERVLVHCHAGISRSATAVLLWLMADGDMRLGDALARLRRVRPFVRPNDGFMRCLRATDQQLARRRAQAGQAPRAQAGAARAPQMPRARPPTPARAQPPAAAPAASAAPPTAAPAAPRQVSRGVYRAPP